MIDDGSKLELLTLLNNFVGQSARGKKSSAKLIENNSAHMNPPLIQEFREEFEMPI